MRLQVHFTDEEQYNRQYSEDVRCCRREPLLSVDIVLARNIICDYDTCEATEVSEDIRQNKVDVNVS